VSTPNDPVSVRLRSTRGLILTLLAAGAALAVLLLPAVASGVEDEPDPEPASCQPGTFSASGAVPCTDAPAGTFVATEGATAATPCDAGRYNDLTGQTSAAACEPVPAGSFSGVGAATPTLCAPGSFSASTGAASCTPAPAGSFVASAGATSATTCSPGTFSAEPGASACTPAPAGRFVAGNGATSATPCATGTYQPATGATSCIPAPAGSFVPTTGSTAAALCQPGSYMPTTGAAACTPASRGSYVPRAGATSQLACASSTVVGASTCPGASGAGPTPAEGTVDDGPSLRADGEACPPGTWSVTGTVPSGGTCIPARPGSFAAGPGATAEVDCEPGTFSDAFGLEACTPAPAGTYVPLAGAAEALPCEGSSVVGATVCEELTVAVPVMVGDDAARSGPGLTTWLLLVGVVLALVAAVLVVLERRRPGSVTSVLGIGGRAPGADGRGHDRSVPLPAVTSAPPVGGGTPDVLEWDELLDDPGHADR
jgi:hypothetical protein